MRKRQRTIFSTFKTKSRRRNLIDMKDITYEIKKIVDQFVNDEIDFDKFFDLLSNKKFTKQELFVFICIQAKLKKQQKNIIPLTETIV